MRNVLRVALAVCLVAAAAGLLRAGAPVEVKPVLDKAIKAAGGEANAGKLRAMTWKGSSTLNIGGNELSLKHDVSAQGWDQYRLELEVQAEGQAQNITIVVTGDKIWVMTPDGKVKDEKKEAGFVKGFLYGLRATQMLPALRQGKGMQFSHLGEVKVADHDAVGLSVTQKGRPDLHLFFDKGTGLPLKSEVRLKTPDGQERQFEFLLDNYKEFDGLKHATKITVRVDGTDYVTELSEVQARGELDASTFAKP
jgi:hypothetical protein